MLLISLSSQAIRRMRIQPVCHSGGPTDPQAIVLATPVLVVAGNMTLLVVIVTPGTNPTSSGINVTGNLTSYRRQLLTAVF